MSLTTTAAGPGAGGGTARATTAAGPGAAAPRGPLRGLPGPRPVRLGVFALAEAAAVGWIAVARTKPPAPSPGDHAWFHSSAPEVAAEQATSAGLLLALVTAAFYLLLPLLGLAARVLRRRAGRLARPAFAVVAGIAGAAVSVPVVALATALAPAGVPLWSAVTADAVTALRFTAPLAVLLTVCVGVPWSAAGTGRPSRRRKPGPC
ncbi:hypothetical protein [Streptomyces sp. NPDC050856]|uniref:hypothetical protein n=1 Tax=Streptomyces sp. NPDC050856 TaxID=3154939 RepID=UPI0033F3676C